MKEHCLERLRDNTFILDTAERNEEECFSTYHHAASGVTFEIASDAGVQEQAVVEANSTEKSFRDIDQQTSRGMFRRLSRLCSS